MSTDDTRTDPWAPPPKAGASEGAPAGAWLAPAGAPPSPWQAPQARPECPGTNRLAIASLVSGITCCLWPAALGLGIGALVQLRRRRQRGKGLAIAGVVLGVLGLLACVVSVTTLVTKSRISFTGHPKSTEQLRVGDCFTRSPFGSQVVTVTCDMRHDAEVSGVVHLTGSSFPGKDAAAADARRQCDGADLSYIYDPWAWTATMRAGEFAPTDKSQWDKGKGTAVCYLFETRNAGRTESVRDDARTLTTDQYAFLNAVHGLDSDTRLTGRQRIRQTAQDLAAAAKALDRLTWSGPRKPEVGALITELKADQPSWQAAADDTGTPPAQLLSQLGAHDPTIAEVEARHALGLPERDGSGLNVPPAQAQ